MMEEVTFQAPLRAHFRIYVSLELSQVLLTSIGTVTWTFSSVVTTRQPDIQDIWRGAAFCETKEGTSRTPLRRVGWQTVISVLQLEPFGLMSTLTAGWICW